MPDEIDKRIEEIEARANAATAGPWKASWGYVGADRRLALVRPDEDGVDFGGTEQDDIDCEFCAECRDDIPWLLAQLRAARAENDRLRTSYCVMCGRITEHCPSSTNTHGGTTT